MILNVDLLILNLILVIVVSFICTIDGDTVDKIDFAGENEFPYIVSLQTRENKSSPWKHQSHGILIHKRWILTSFSGAMTIDIYLIRCKDIRAKLNQDNILNSTIDRNEKIRQLFFHKFLIDKNSPDAVLVQLTKPVKDSKIVPIKLSKQSYKYGTKLYLPSWGKSKPRGFLPRIDSKLRKKVVTIKYYEDCKMPDFGKGPVPSNVYYFCGDAGWCASDEGAPLVIKNSDPEEDILVGYSGYGSLMEECWRSPHYHSNVTAYLPWINSILKKHGDTLEE